MAEEPRTQTEKLLQDEGPQEKEEKTVKTKTVSSSNEGESSSRSAEKRTADEKNLDDSVAGDANNKPTPPKVSKIGFSLGSALVKKPAPISIKLGANKPKESLPVLAPKKPSVAAVFNEDEDSEPEEMPPEAKMRMKNMGRETPTSAGPNSFNKGKQGFSDHHRLWERKMKNQMQKFGDD